MSLLYRHIAARRRPISLVLVCLLPFSLYAKEDDVDADIVVTGSRREQRLKDSPVMTEVIRREDIVKEGARNAADVLSNRPGIEIRPAAAGQRGEVVRLQGFDGRYVLILVNGDRLSGRVGENIDLTRIKAEEIERIEIVKGASSALYGSDAIGGVINIITREGKDPFEGEVIVQGGSGRTTHFGSTPESNASSRLSFRNETLSTNFYAGWHKSDGYDLTPDASSGPQSDRIRSLSPVYDPFPRNTPVLSQLIAARFGLDPANLPAETTTANAYRDINAGGTSAFHLTKSASLLTNIAYRQLDQTGVDFAPPRAIYDRKTATQDLALGFGPRIELGADALLKLKYNYSRFLDEYSQDQRASDAGDRKETTDERLSEFRMQVDYRLLNHTITAGVDALANEISSPRIDLPCKRDFPYVCLNTLIGAPPARDSGFAERERIAVFGQDEWTVLDASRRLILVPGVRYERDSQFGDATLPKFSARFDAADRLTFRLSAGAGYRAPSFKELYFDFQNPGVGYQVKGNDDLEPERSKSLNAGFEWKRPRVYFQFNAFGNMVDNLIDFKRIPGLSPDGLTTFRTANYKKALTQGAEFSFNFKILRNLSIDLGYTYTDTRDLDENVPLEGRPYHRGNFRLNYEYTPWTAGFRLFGSVAGKAPYYCQKSPFWCDDPRQPPMKPYSRETEVLSKLDPRLIQYCDDKNIAACRTAAQNGVVMRNSYNQLNVRFFKKWRDHVEFFFGVDNILDNYNVQYNPVRPRYYYVGLIGTFGFDSEREIRRARESDQYRDFRKKDKYEEFKDTEEYRRMKDRHDSDEFQRYLEYQRKSGHAD